MSSKPTPTDKQILDALIASENNISQAARVLGMPRSTLQGRIENMKIAENTDRIEEISGDHWVIKTDDPKLQTPEDAIRSVDFDPAVWEVEKVTKVTRSWDVTMKLQSQGEDVPHTQKNQYYSFTIVLRRKVPKLVADGADEFLSRIAKLAPTFKVKSTKRKLKTEPLWAVFSIYDTHFGKLAWKPEVGENYDLKIAEEIYTKAVDDLLDYTVGREIQQIDLPVGNDAIHIDKLDNTTTAGTQVDTDGRLPKIFNTCVRAHIRAVGRMVEVFPGAKVNVSYVPGNHDFATSWFLVKYLEAYFRNHPQVTVDAGPSPRKYQSFGVNAILFTHGKDEKLDRLPYIMAAEKPEMWASTDCREAHTGHRHSKGEVRWVDTEEYEGFVVRRIPSLTPPDAWHYQKGYVNNRRAAEVFLYSRDNGYFGHFSANV